MAGMPSLGGAARHDFVHVHDRRVEVSVRPLCGRRKQLRCHKSAGVDQPPAEGDENGDTHKSVGPTG